MAVDQASLAERCVDAINAISGSHPGNRAAHAKGTLCAGTFTPSPDAAALSRAAHLQGDPVRVTVRLSNGSGDPGAPDGERRDGRGMAIKLYLPDGTTTDIVAITIPVFFVRDPQEFLGFTLARKPDPETDEIDMEKIGAFISEHPATGAAHVATDHLRNRLFIAATYADEENEAVFGIAEALVDQLLAEGHAVVLDATHLLARYRSPAEKVARASRCASPCSPGSPRRATRWTTRPRPGRRSGTRSSSAASS